MTPQSANFKTVHKPHSASYIQVLSLVQTFFHYSLVSRYSPSVQIQVQTPRREGTRGEGWGRGGTPSLFVLACPHNPNAQHARFHHELHRVGWFQYHQCGHIPCQHIRGGGSALLCLPHEDLGPGWLVVLPCVCQIWQVWKNGSVGVGRDHPTQGNNIWDMAAAFYGPPHLYIWNRERQTTSKQCSQSGALPGSVLTQPLPGPATLTSQYSQYTSRFNHRATLIRLHTNRLAWR